MLQSCTAGARELCVNMQGGVDLCGCSPGKVFRGAFKGKQRALCAYSVGSFVIKPGALLACFFMQGVDAIWLRGQESWGLSTLQRSAGLCLKGLPGVTGWVTSRFPTCVGSQ